MFCRWGILRPEPNLIADVRIADIDVQRCWCCIRRFPR
jgi:hypothetical protein